jgi:hypothetical protein
MRMGITQTLNLTTSQSYKGLCPKIRFCPKYRESAQDIEKYRLGVDVRCLALEAFSNV